MAGRTNTRRMHKLRDEFLEEGRRLDAAGNPDADCWICKQHIDYAALANTTPSSHSLDHYYPVSQYPELQEDVTNFRHSHTQCNTERGNRSPSVGLGTAVADWF